MSHDYLHRGQPDFDQVPLRHPLFCELFGFSQFHLECILQEDPDRLDAVDLGHTLNTIMVANNNEYLLILYIN